MFATPIACTRSMVLQFYFRCTDLIWRSKLAFSGNCTHYMYGSSVLDGHFSYVGSGYLLVFATLMKTLWVLDEQFVVLLLTTLMFIHATPSWKLLATFITCIVLELLWTLFLCWFSLHFSENCLPHSLHVWFFSFRWIRFLCLFRPPLSEKCLPQSLHL